MPKVYDHLDERQFLVAVRRLADTLATGADASPYVGAGVDYAQSRPYEPGDSTRAIDWRVTARTGKPFVKEYEAHKRLTMHFIVDASASMHLGAAPQSKFEWAVMLAGAMALSAVHQQNPVSLHATAEGNPHLQTRPSLLRDQVHQWIAAVRDPAVATARCASVATILQRIDITSPERGVMIVLSDLHEPAAIPMLKQLAQRHDVMVLHLTDIAEHALAGGGFFRGAEAETGRSFFGFGRRKAADFADVASQLSAAQVDCISLRAGDDFLPRLQNFLKQRKRGR